MFTQRTIFCVLALLSRIVAFGGEDIALDRYNARLEEIARSYKQQFTEIRKSQRRIGSAKADFRAAERQIEELGMMRSTAIAEAKLIYQKELKDGKRTDVADAEPVPRLSREERQRELMAARRRLFEEGQKAFWERVAQEEPKIAELMAARRKAVEEELTAFWAELFEPSKVIGHDRPPTAAIQTAARPVEKQTIPPPQQNNTNVRMQGPVLAAVH